MTAKILAVATAVAVLAAPAAGNAQTAARTGRADTRTRIFASGGTPLTNGIFYPGTIIQVGGAKYGEPYEVARGSNIEFVNTDPEATANSHCMISVKRKKRTRRPLFASRCIKGPSVDVVVTSHLKPGTYEFFCPIHFGMLGAIEVTD